MLPLLSAFVCMTECTRLGDCLYGYHHRVIVNPGILIRSLGSISVRHADMHVSVTLVHVCTIVLTP